MPEVFHLRILWTTKNRFHPILLRKSPKRASYDIFQKYFPRFFEKESPPIPAMLLFSSEQFPDCTHSPVLPLSPPLPPPFRLFAFFLFLAPPAPLRKKKRHRPFKHSLRSSGFPIQRSQKAMGIAGQRRSCEFSPK